MTVVNSNTNCIKELTDKDNFEPEKPDLSKSVKYVNAQTLSPDRKPFLDTDGN